MIGSLRYPYSFRPASDKYNMDINLDNIALELYGKLQTRFPNVEIGDETGEVLSKKEDIPKARFFEFPYKERGVTLGTITITLDQDDGVILQVGGELVDSDTPGIFNFVRSMGSFANNRLLNFKIVNLEKSNLDKRDYEFQAKRKEPEPMEPMMESKMYGTSKISYQDLGEARIVIKHSQPVNTEIAAGRTMHVERIYVENAMGERFAYPTKHLNGARALAEHLKHGGNPYDDIGKHITGLSEELAQLRKFKGYVSRNEALSEAMGDITSKVMERIEAVKKEVHQLQRPAFYETFAESFQSRDEEMVPESVMDDWIDRLTVRTFNEELKSAFPFIFKLVSESDIPVKELTADDLLAERATPEYLANVEKAKALLQQGVSIEQVGRQLGAQGPNNNVAGPMGGVWGAINDAGRQIPPTGRRVFELSKDTLNSYINKSTYNGDDDRDGEKSIEPKRIDGVTKAAYRTQGLAPETKKDGWRKYSAKESIEDAFESFINGIVEDGEGDQTGTDTLFSQNKDEQQAAIQKINAIMAAELKGGPDGINAIESLKGIIDNPEFLMTLKDIDPDLDTRGLIQQYILQTAPEIAAQLTFGDAAVGGEEPVAPEAPLEPAPAPAAPAEPAAAELPAEPAAAPAPAAPIAENTARLKAKFIKAKECGATLDTKMDFGNREMTLHDALKECGMDPQDVGFEPEVSAQEELEKIVSGFWNREAGNFTTGGTKAKIQVLKAFKDGQVPNATPEDVKAVLAKIEQMDPSTEHDDMMKLSGIQQPDDHRPSIMIAKVGAMTPMESKTYSEDPALARIIQLSR